MKIKLYRHSEGLRIKSLKGRKELGLPDPLGTVPSVGTNFDNERQNFSPVPVLCGAIFIFKHRGRCCAIFIAEYTQERVQN